MSIELKQAAQDAAEAIDWLLKNIRLDAPHLSGKAMGNAEKCASALRTAIQQAEAKTGEPVAWVYQNANTDSEYLVWKHGQGGRNWRPLFTHPAQGVPAADAEWRDVIQGAIDALPYQHHLIPRLVALLSANRPAPGVPDDAARDAISLVREQYRGTDWGKAAEGICDAIDAAMLAAAQTQKGQP